MVSEELSTPDGEALPNAVIAEAETFLARNGGGLKAYVDGGGQWSRLRSTIWLAIHRLAALTPPQANDEAVEAVARLIEAAEGLAFGVDWNNGTAASLYREKLLAAVKPARAAVEAMQLQSGGDWLPIDSAPRDGTEFQAWVTVVGGEGFWEPKCRINPDSEAFEIWGRVDYDHDDWDSYSHIVAIAWMSLPAAPAKESE